jgi:hypothetical protein
LRKEFLPAIKAFPARNVVLSCNTVPDCEPGYFGSYLYHSTRDFMAEYPRRGNETVLNFLKIGAANPAGVHPQQNFTS